MKGLLLAVDPRRDLRWPHIRPRVAQLAPVANRPIALHGLDRLRESGATRIGVAVCEATAGALRELLGDGTRGGTEISYLAQPESASLLSSIHRADTFTAGEDLLVHRSDVVVTLDGPRLIAEFYDKSLDVLTVVPAEPGDGPGSDDLTALGVFSRRALDAVATLVSERPDAGLPDLFRLLWSDGRRVATTATPTCAGLRPDQSSLLDASHVALDSLPCNANGPHGSGRGVSVSGAAKIDKSAVIESSTFRGPVLVGPRTQIRQAFIGPYTSIGADVLIEGAEIENSVVMRDVVLRHLPQRIDSSILATGTRVCGDFGLPRALRLQLGERSEVVLP